MGKLSVGIKVDWSKSQEMLNDIVMFSRQRTINQWILGYMKLFDNIGDLFDVNSKGDLKIEIVPSKDLIQLYEGARRRYERLDT